MQQNREWFTRWFNSPYYHILYQHRDHEEARHFIDQIAALLNISSEDKVLDLACGKGRHAVYLNRKGYDVIGLDLSPKNIESAKKHENDRLHFHVHDMRHTWEKEAFDYIFNLFTSFGYFSNESEHQQAIQSIADALKPGGRLILDFLNPYTVIHHMVPEEIKLIDGIAFHIRKYLNDENCIIKEISFDHNNKEYEFQEKVKAIRRVQFLSYFEKAGLNVLRIYGDYDLNTYIAEQSERMIFLVQK